MELDTIVVGDCLDVMADMPDGCVDLVVTDPPYGAVNRPSGGLRNLDKGDADDITVLLPRWLIEIDRILKGSFYSFCAAEQVSPLFEFLNRYNYTTRLGFWEKTNPSPMNGQYIWLSGIRPIVFGKKRGATFNEFCTTLVFRHPVVRGIDHSTPKPVSIIEKMILVSSNEGNSIFDPFMGSGTTAVAALKLGRHFYGCDINQKYVELANERIEKARLETAQLSFLSEQKIGQLNL